MGFGTTQGRVQVAALTLALGGWMTTADAHVTQLVITRTESPTFQGASFGETGPYEKLVGRATGEIDARDPRNAVITDIMLAPRNARGMVEYATDIYILRPVDPSRGNRKVLFELNNRGNMVSFGLLNDATTGGNDPTTGADAGIGFLMRLGYTIVQSGWDATVLAGGGRQTISVPLARNPDGTSIIGPSLEELVIDNATTLTAPLTYAAATFDTAQAMLTVRPLRRSAGRDPKRELGLRQRSNDPAAASRNCLPAGHALRADVSGEGSARRRSRLRGGS